MKTEDEFDTPFGRLDIGNLLDTFKVLAITGNDQLIEDQKSKIERYVLSEAHRIGVKAIGDATGFIKNPKESLERLEADLLARKDRNNYPHNDIWQAKADGLNNQTKEK